jgi:hypothetical protein
MSKKKLMVLALAVLCTLLVTGVALSMSSTNFRLDWFTPLTGGGGGAATSSNYAANLTVGQSVTGLAASTHHRGCLGYWCAADMEVESRVFLPSVLRNH